MHEGTEKLDRRVCVGRGPGAKGLRTALSARYPRWQDYKTRVT